MSATASTSSPSQAPAPEDKQLPTPFICFRSNFCALNPQAVMESWRQSTKEQRAYWEEIAAEKKLEHKLKYPDHKLQPASAGEKKLLQTERKKNREEKKRAQENQRRKEKRRE